MTDIDVIRSRHADCTPGRCAVMSGVWADGDSPDTVTLDAPCDTAVVLAALAEKQAELFRMSDVLTAMQEQCEQRQQEALAQRDAARKGADRLASAIRRIRDYEATGGPDLPDWDAQFEYLYAALAAHERATDD
jgi:hypothetical protein